NGNTAPETKREALTARLLETIGKPFLQHPWWGRQAELSSIKLRLTPQKSTRTFYPPLRSGFCANQRTEHERGSATQIGVVASDPVFPDGREDVDGDAVFERLDAVGDIRRNAERFAGSDDDLFGGGDEEHGAFFHSRDLLIDVAVRGDQSALARSQPGHG